LGDRIDFEKTRRETARLLMLRALYAARPIDASDRDVLHILSDFRFSFSLDDVRRELDYLRLLGLIETGQDEDIGWWARPTALGIAVVEHNAPVPRGVAAPIKHRNLH
jgi:hypothetical protein